MESFRISLEDDEVAFVKTRPKGWARGLIIAAMEAPEGAVARTVYLTPEEEEYVADREAKNGSGWFGRVAQVNMKAALDGKPPFYWMLPEGLDSEDTDKMAEVRAKLEAMEETP